MNVVVMDECDQLLGAQSKADTKSLLNSADVIPSVDKLQNILFSATQPRALLNDIRGVVQPERLDVLLCEVGKIPESEPPSHKSKSVDRDECEQ